MIIRIGGVKSHIVLGVAMVRRSGVIDIHIVFNISRMLWILVYHFLWCG